MREVKKLDKRIDKVDLIIQNGEVCTSHERYRADIAIHDEKIVSIGNGNIMPPARKVIDAQGKIIIPGGIFTHCHYRDPGFTYKEDFTTGTRAAVTGGVTTSFAMTNVKPYPTTLDNFEKWKEDAAKKCLTDFCLYGGYGRTTSTFAEIGKMAKAGAIGMKVFQFEDFRSGYPHVPELAITNWGDIHEIFENSAAAGIPVAVHPGLSDWSNRLVVRDFINKGKNSIKAYREIAEKGYLFGHEMVMGTYILIYLAKLTKARLLVLHVGIMKEEAYDLFRQAKSAGQDVYAEMECIPLFMTPERDEKMGIYNLGFKGFRDKEAGWKAINDGTVDICLIEHAPHAKKDVEPAKQAVWDAHTGPMGAQEFLPLMLTAVNEKKLTLQKVVAVTSENAAKIFGIYPKKGAIQIGSDADLAIIDMNKEETMTHEKVISKAGFTPWDGYHFKGMPVCTILRGKVVMEDGNITGQAGDGKFVPGTAAQ
jgi:dihydroorotase (multifunctional complex type)